MDVNEELKLLCKCTKKNNGVGVLRGVQGGCERRIEFIAKMKKEKKKGEGEVMLDVNE